MDTNNSIANIPDAKKHPGLISALFIIYQVEKFTIYNLNYKVLLG